MDIRKKNRSAQKLNKLKHGMEWKTAWLPTQTSTQAMAPFMDDKEIPASV